MSGKTVTRLRAALVGTCLIAMGIFFSGVANAQGIPSKCMPIAKAMADIAGPEFGEGPAFKGVVDGPDGTLIPLMGFANRETGTFTILLRPAPGVACPLTSGAEFDMLEHNPPPPKMGPAT